MKKIVLTAMIIIIASANFLYAQSSWNLSSATANYNLGSGTGTAPKIREGNSLDLKSTTTTSDYLPRPIDGVVNAFTSSSGGKFTLEDTDPAEASLTFSGSKSISFMNRFSMYDLSNASPLTKLSFKISFNDNGADYQEWYLTLGNKQTGSDSVFTKTSAISNNKSYYEVFNTFKWVITNTVTGDKSINFQYRRKNSPISVHTYIDISPTLFEQGKTYNVEIICNNTNQTQEFILGGQTIDINSRRTMIVVDGNIVTVANLASAANSNQIYSNVMPINTSINSLAFSGYTSNSNVSGVADSEITLSNVNWNYVLPSVLPVSFTSFTGKSTNEGVQLRWATASEKNNTHFEIYKSQDGQVFSRIGSVSGNLNTDQKNNYSFIDKYPFADANYYQLKQVDIDGKSSTYDKVISVIHHIGKDIFNVFVSPEKQININLSSNEDEVIVIRLTDSTGRIIYKTNESLTQNENRIQLPYLTLSSGVYMVSIIYPNAEIKTTKIIL